MKRNGERGKKENEMKWRIERGRGRKEERGKEGKGMKWGRER
jgi:hypothetical protein